MDLTTAVAALKIKFDFKVGYPTTTPNRVSIIDDSSSISLSGTEAVKYLFKITSPSGAVIYKNSGYDSDNYASSDKGTSNTYDIPLTTAGVIEEGVYKAEVKVQYTNSVGSIDTRTTKTILTKELCLCDKPTVVVSHSYDREVATFTSTDETSYSSSNLTYDSVTKDHVIIPPIASGLSQLTGTSTILTYNQLWSGTWQSQVKSYAVFKGLNVADNSATNPCYSYFTFYCVGSETTEVSGEDLICKMNCAIKVLEKKWKEEKGKTKDALFDKFTAGTNILTIAMNAEKCGDSDNLAYLYDRFFEVTGIDKNCDCCADGEVGRILPSSSSGGGSTSIITFTPSVVEEVAYKSGTGLFATQDSPNVYSFKFKNQVWKTILDYGTTPSSSDLTHLLNDSPQVFVPVTLLNVPADECFLKMRYLYDGKFEIKGQIKDSYSAGDFVSGVPVELHICNFSFLPSNGGGVSFHCVINHAISTITPSGNARKTYQSEVKIESDNAINGGVPRLVARYYPAHSAGDNVFINIDDILELKDIFL